MDNKQELTSPRFIQSHQSNVLKARHYMNGDLPQSGYVVGPGLTVVWQDGPREKLSDGTLAAANGAFVEDVLVAAYERLAFFQATKFNHPANQEAMSYIVKALDAMQSRATQRAAAGKLGQQEV